LKDFTLDKYRQVLSAIKGLSIPVHGVADWIRCQPKDGILLRHDVDRRDHCALAMARAEKDYDIHSTYYFRCRADGFQRRIIEQIAGWGHEIGYHYEELAVAQGDMPRAWAMFQEHLERLRAIVPVDTIAMHGSPLSPHDNRALFRHHDLTELGLLGDAYLTLDYSGCFYFSDTGRTWHATPLNFRDQPMRCRLAAVSSTDELVHFIRHHHNERIALLSHPERWPNSVAGYIVSWISDKTANGIKRMILMRQAHLS